LRFARVGQVLYKAADVGADLVGKVKPVFQKMILAISDHCRQCRDNVGDVAGMGADLFGSYVATVLAAMVLGNYVIRDMVAIL
jgi:K(+)-stimulated pyrophosphate-energized sodium pump